MATYRFTFHDCDGTVSELATDVDAADLAGARAAAMERAREIMAGEIRRGRLCLSCWIVIGDHAGTYLTTLQFGDAIEMRAEPACEHQTEAQARASA